MLIIAAPRIFVKGAVFFCPAYSGVLVASAKNLVLSPKVCYTSNAAEKRQGAACIDRWSCSLRQAPGEGTLIAPRTQPRKGGCQNDSDGIHSFARVAGWSDLWNFSDLMGYL